MTEIRKGWRVVVEYDDPRGGIWRGPIRDTFDEGLRDLAVEQARVHGTAWLEEVVQ